MNNYDGSLVVLEGVDGAGKGMVIDELKENHFPDFEYTHEPSTGKYGRYLREELKSDNDPTVSDFFLFCADRIDHIETLIGPKLEKGETVVSDRYNLSTFAYQSQVIDEQLDVIDAHEYIENIVGAFVIEPDLTIVIDAPVADTFDRLDGDKEKYEKVNRLESARETYLHFAEKLEYAEVVSGKQDIDDVVQDCADLINEV